MAELPSTIKILHKVFSVIEKTERDMYLDGRMAEIDFLGSEIKYISLGGSETVDSIVHEVLHGIIRTMNINHNISDELEEYIVTALATGLTTVMYDNPDLFPVLQELVEENDS